MPILVSVTLTKKNYYNKPVPWFTINTPLLLNGISHVVINNNFHPNKLQLHLHTTFYFQYNFVHSMWFWCCFFFFLVCSLSLPHCSFSFCIDFPFNTKMLFTVMHTQNSNIYKYETYKYLSFIRYDSPFFFLHGFVFCYA